MSKPVASGLEASCTRLLHVAPLLRLSDHWVTNCASEPWIIDPVNAVQGELSSQTIHASATRLHIFLSPASDTALQKMRDGVLRVPEMREGDSKELPLAPEIPESGTRVYAAGSFMRRDLEKAVTSFMQGLRLEYEEMDLAFMQPDGAVKIGASTHQWTHILQRIPDYFLHVLKDYALQTKTRRFPKHSWKRFCNPSHSFVRESSHKKFHV